MKIVHLICAARPNFMKVAPLYHALKKTDWCKPVIVWGDQHRDANMSAVFLEEFGVKVDLGFDVTGRTHVEQIASAMLDYETQCDNERPDAIVVVGDVNTTMACALVGAKLGILVVHLEAGLRSFDRSMPEEINRVVTDAVSDVLLTPSLDAVANLANGGIRGERGEKVEFVGNIMIDAFEMLRPQIEAVPKREGPYAVVTLHRPSNVDDGGRLLALLAMVDQVTEYLPVVFPTHPRTQQRMWDFGLTHGRAIPKPPLPYVEFMALVKGATIVITDSGGVQEETSYLGVPCATVRENTERPVTISHGTNELIGPAEIAPSALRALRGDWKKGGPIPLWDGKTAERCVAVLKTFLNA